MKTIIKKTVILIIACAMLISVVALAGCNDEGQQESDVSSESTPEDNQGSESTEPLNIPIDLSQFYEQPLLDRLNKSFIIDGHTISASEYNFFYMAAYSEYSSYAYSGYYPATYQGMLDLEAQCELLSEEGATWGDFIDQQVEREIRKVYILSSLARDEGLVLTDENLESIEATIEFVKNEAIVEGLTPETYLAQYYGEEMSFDLLANIMERNFLSNNYYEHFLANYEFSEEEIMIPFVRHILFPVGEDATEEEIIATQEMAEGIFEEVTSYEDMVLLGEREKNAGNVQESAEFTVMKNQTVVEFDQWCFDPLREEGDVGVVQTRFGFHIIYYIGREEASEQQKDRMAEFVLADILDDLVETDRFALIPA